MSEHIVSMIHQNWELSVLHIPYHLMDHLTWYNAVIAGSLDGLSPRQFNGDCSCVSLSLGE